VVRDGAVPDDVDADPIPADGVTLPAPKTDACLFVQPYTTTAQIAAHSEGIQTLHVAGRQPTSYRALNTHTKPCCKKGRRELATIEIVQARRNRVEACACDAVSKQKPEAILGKMLKGKVREQTVSPAQLEEQTIVKTPQNLMHRPQHIHLADTLVAMVTKKNGFGIAVKEY
jgi:translation elongation factor EF-Ts